MKKLFAFIICLSFIHAKFIRFDDGNFVIDTKTKLMWSDSSEIFLNWSNALAYCNDFNRTFSINGENFLLDNWRLPNHNELITLVDYNKTNHAFPSAFKFLAPLNTSTYFSSTTYIKDTSKAYGISKAEGLDVILAKNIDSYVKCIRDLE